MWLDQTHLLFRDGILLGYSRRLNRLVIKGEENQPYAEYPGGS